MKYIAKNSLNAETRMKWQKWVVLLSIVFLRLMQQKGHHLESNIRVKLHSGKHLPKMGRCLHKVSWVTRPQLITNRSLNIMQKSLHNTALKKSLFLITEKKSQIQHVQILHAYTVTTAKNNLPVVPRVQDRVYFREDDIYHYRQWNRPYKSVTLQMIVTFDILNLAVIEKCCIFALMPVKFVKQ